MSKKIINISLVALAGTLIAIGVSQEQYVSVFVKAINICLECIGIG